MDIGRTSKNWEKRGFSCGEWIDSPGQVWENYVHDVDELFMVLEGTVELEMKGDIFCPKREEEILIPANVVHSVRNKGKTQSRWLYGYFQK